MDKFVAGLVLWVALFALVVAPGSVQVVEKTEVPDYPPEDL